MDNNDIATEQAATEAEGTFTLSLDNYLDSETRAFLDLMCAA